MSEILVVHPDEPDLAIHDGANQVNERLVRALSGEHSVRRLWPVSPTRWATQMYGLPGGGTSTRFGTVDDLVGASRVDLLAACHSYYPEVMAAARRLWDATTVLLLHSVKAESVLHERSSTSELRIPFDDEDAERKLMAERACLGLADRVVTVSASLRRELAGHHTMHAQVVLNPFEIAWYGSGRPLEFAPGGLSFAVVGRPDVRKGIHLAFAAVQQARAETGLGLQLYLAGACDGRSSRANGHNRTYLALLQDICAHSWVHNLGVLTPEGVRQLFAETHAAIVPSLYDAFGYAAAEALAFSPRPIVSARGGPLELQRLFGRGVAVDPSGPSLTTAIRAALDAPAEGVVRIPSELSLDRWERDWANVVTGAIGIRTPCSPAQQALSVSEDAQVALAEFGEARKEINHFQAATSAMVFGALGFYVAAAGFGLKFLTDLSQEQLARLVTLDLPAVAAAIFVTLNAFLSATFVSYSFSVLRASRFIHEVLRPRLTARSEDPLGYEAYYSASRITLFAEGVPVMLFLALIHASSWAAVAFIWLGDRHTGAAFVSGIWATLLEVATSVWVAVWAFHQINKGQAVAGVSHADS